MSKMINDENRLWEHLKEYQISKLKIVRKEIKKENGISPEKKFSFKWGGPFEGIWHLNFYPAYSQFIINIYRAMTFYPEIIIKTKLDEEEFDIKRFLLCQNFLILLINSLECFLVRLFKSTADMVRALSTNKTYLIKFIKKFSIREEFFNCLKAHGNLDFSLSELIPERIDLQQYDKCKAAFNLIGIDLPKIDNILWEKIFSSPKDSYMEKRHRIIHAGLPDINKISIQSEIEYIEFAILDIAKFVNNVMVEWISKYHTSPIQVIIKDPKSYNFENMRKILNLEKKELEEKISHWNNKFNVKFDDDSIFIDNDKVLRFLIDLLPLLIKSKSDHKEIWAMATPLVANLTPEHLNKWQSTLEKLISKFEGIK